MTETTTCCIAGGGPAGAMLGLLLARSGIDVIVLEKHADFLRDFRGDTIHPSTLDVLDEIGLSDRFDALEHRKARRLELMTDEGEVTIADLDLLKSRHPYIAFVPQWDFLTMVTEAAARYPNFRLLMRAEAYDLVREEVVPGGTGGSSPLNDRHGRVAGLRYRDEKGEEHEIRAVLTVAADGRHSTLQRAARLRPREYGAPMDVAWFRLPRADTDPENPFLRASTGHVVVVLNRGSYWQLGYIVPKGGYDRLREQGIKLLRERLSTLLPFLAGRTDQLDFDAISVLEVRVNRLRRWHLPGLLFIGDAAHAMSPIGGVGINLAIQDAVAAANLLYEPLRRGVVRNQDLAAVQRRRFLPAVAVQRFQITVQNAVVAPTLRGEGLSRPPRLLTLAQQLTIARRLIARMGGYGPRPEHVRIPEIPAAPR